MTRIVALVAVFVSLQATPAAEKEEVPLFSLTRTTNRNTVIYAAIVRDEQFSEDRIEVYWKMLEKSGQREALTSVERKKLYGVEIISSNKEEITFSLKARPRSPLTARFRLVNGKKKPFIGIKIDGQESELERIHLNLKGTSMVPRIESVEYYGTSLKTGAPLHEIQNLIGA